MIAAPARVGARGTDSVQSIDPAHAAGLKAAGIDFCVRYLGSVTAAELGAILDAGLGFMPVTFAERFDGGAAVGQCRALGLPAGTTVWLDVEGNDAWNTPPADLIAKINAWASAVSGAGYMPGLYVGAPQPLTSEELYGLAVVRYWHGQGRAVDRNGALAEPKCGWCMFQAYPSVSTAGVWTDLDFVTADYEKRLPAWAVKS